MSIQDSSTGYTLGYTLGVALSLRSVGLAVYGRMESGTFTRHELPALKAVARELAGLAVSLPHGHAVGVRDTTIALAVALSALLNVLEDEGRDARTVYQVEYDAAMTRSAAEIDLLLKRTAEEAADLPVLVSDSLGAVPCRDR